jgi:preprotein translocase subunit YajC
MFTGLAYAASGQGTQVAQPGPVMSFLPLIIIFLIFYFLLIRPQQKRQQEHAKMIESVKKNDEIITSGGIHAVVVNVKENTVMARIDDNVKIEISKNAVAAIKKPHKQ